MTLFDNSYKCLEKHIDDEGRMAVVVIENDIMKSIIVNVYCPNDHRASLGFMEKVYDKIFEVMDKHPFSSWLEISMPVCQMETQSID